MEASNGAQQKQEGADILAARINRLPEFWENDPAMWFFQIEATFDIYGITNDKTKFKYILAHANHQILPFVTHIMKQEDVPEQDRYKKVKERIIKAFSDSEEMKLRKVLKGQVMGDKKPSQVLQQLINASANQFNDTVLKTLFLEQLPDAVRTILAVSSKTELEELAAIADKIVETSSPAQVMEIKSQTSATYRSDLESTIGALTQQVRELTAIVKKSQQIIFRHRSRSKSGDRFSNSNGNKGNKDFHKPTGLCFYHNRFKGNAKNCTPPCSWVQFQSKTEN